jgi:hypothetical protein
MFISNPITSVQYIKIILKMEIIKFSTTLRRQQIKTQILFLWRIPKIVYSLRNIVLCAFGWDHKKINKIMGNTKCVIVNLGFALFVKTCSFLVWLM